jgi:hypothetical protein
MNTRSLQDGRRQDEEGDESAEEDSKEQKVIGIIETEPSCKCQS